MHYSVVGLKIGTIHCSVISVETVHFSPAISRPVVIFGPLIFMSCIFMSCIFMSCNFLSCNFIPCNQFHVLQISPSFSRPAFSVKPRGESRFRNVSNFTTASCSFSCHITAFLYRPTSATVQMLKLHTAYADFHGRDTKSRR